MNALQIPFKRKIFKVDSKRTPNYTLSTENPLKI